MIPLYCRGIASPKGDFFMDKQRPRCPLCGANSGWNVLIPQDKTKKWVKTPDLCRFCKEEDKRHTREWIVGPDVVDSWHGRTWADDPFKRK